MYGIKRNDTHLKKVADQSLQKQAGFKDYLKEAEGEGTCKEGNSKV